MQQLIFPFSPDTSFRAEDFLVSDCNRKAWLWMQPGRYWPAPVFVLRGAAASGKSHLAHLWAAQHNAPMIAAATLKTRTAPETLYAGGRWLVVEDIERSPSQPALFHLFNYAMQQECSLLLTANDAACWDGFSLPDLRSRLQAAPQAQISEPDELLLTAVLVKQLSDHQLLWNEALITYLMPRIERSFEGVRSIVRRLNRLAMEQKAPVSVALARQLFAVTDQ